MKRILAIAAAIGFALPALAQTKWDLPTAYPANNFHTENLQQFVTDVDKASGGKLILYHGWSGTDVSPLNTLAYH